MSNTLIIDKINVSLASLAMVENTNPLHAHTNPDMYFANLQPVHFASNGIMRLHNMRLKPTIDVLDNAQVDTRDILRDWLKRAGILATVVESPDSRVSAIAAIDRPSGSRTLSFESNFGDFSSILTGWNDKRLLHLVGEATAASRGQAALRLHRSLVNSTHTW